MSSDIDAVRLGQSGLQISRLVLGCISFGDPQRGPHPWTLSTRTPLWPLLTAALEAGITTLDTANVYSAGSSEEIVGRFIADVGSREQFVIATKVHGVMPPGGNGGGLSRRAIMEQIDASLRRLGTDWVDLYQIHRFDSADACRGDHGGSPRRGGRPEKPATSVPPPCGHGSSRQMQHTQQNFTAGPASCPCKTSTTWCSAKKNARCTPTVWPLRSRCAAVVTAGAGSLDPGLQTGRRHDHPSRQRCLRQHVISPSRELRPSDRRRGRENRGGTWCATSRRSLLPGCGNSRW